MGLGVGNHPECETKSAEEGLMNNSKTKDCQNAAAIHAKGICRKCLSRKVPLVYFIAVTTVTFALLIAVIVLSVRETTTIINTGTTTIINTGNTTIINTETTTIINTGNTTIINTGNTGVYQCKDGWIMYRGKCYYISKDFQTWNNSQKLCKEQGASLAVIENTEECEFLSRMKGNYNCWIGLSRTDDSGWVWVNGTLYSENIFRIERLPTTDGDTEHAYLNHDGVKSRGGSALAEYACSVDPSIRGS